MVGSPDWVDPEQLQDLHVEMALPDDVVPPKRAGKRTRLAS